MSGSFTEVEIKNVIIKNNNGAYFNIYSPNNLVLEDLEIINNTTSGSDIIYSPVVDNFYMSNVIARGNKAGGIIESTQTSKYAEIKNVVFENNEVDYELLLVRAENQLIKDVKLINNRCYQGLELYGGAPELGSIISLENIEITGNTSKLDLLELYGAALITLDNVQISDNKVAEEGQEPIIDGRYTSALLRIKNSSISNNNIENAGLLFWMNCPTEIYDTKINDNVFSEGGYHYAINTTENLLLERVSLNGNSGDVGGGGGSSFIYSTKNITLRVSEIKNNTLKNFNSLIYGIQGLSVYNTVLLQIKLIIVTLF